ncbi:tetratricopeptide repeat protein [Plasmodium brasilianum]|uniref:Protein kinase 7, putative n=2 Tax=Plasmodium (Plasmodium) TaxID=418103 RepID=A0A1D3JJ22_PLAMA|nr:protein kinase 7, putative [Plasmodium malariae]KAI4840405.1 tetratricopeptide repeat protein [Plasmodium brasilianum]SBT86494.1 protein kinase 7, putative [Plasmodium malariae]
MKEILRGYSNIVYLNKHVKEKEKYVNCYRIVKTISEGKFSKVILCEKDNKELYALKKYDKKCLENKREFEFSKSNNKIVIKSKYDDLKKELQILMDIKNEYCLTCDEILTNYDEVYIVNKYMENESILKYEQFFFVLDKNESSFIPLSVIKCIVKSILKSFFYIHKQKNICHRDVKPSNILMSKNGLVKLEDFGESEYMTNNMIKGTKGTYEFMPPEFFTSLTSYSGEKTDIWSLGICIFALFYRVLPYTHNNSLNELFHDIGKGEIKYHVQRNYFLTEITKNKSNRCMDYLSNDDINFLKKFLKKDPNERFNDEEALKHSWLRNTDYKCLEVYAKEVYKKKNKL